MIDEELPPDARPNPPVVPNDVPHEGETVQFAGGPNGKVYVIDNGKAVLLRNGQGVPALKLGLKDEDTGLDDNAIDAVASPAEMARGAAEAVKQLMTDGIKTVSLEKRQRRFDVCKECEYFAPKYSRCLKCGCFLKVKVTMAAWHCPLKRW